MQLLAKNILPEKFWIIEDQSNTKLGTIQVEQRQVKVVLNNGEYVYTDLDSALKKHCISASDQPYKKPTKITYNVNGYPVKTQPHNEIYDAVKGLPLYTKTEKSKCYYAAGYYIIRFDSSWVAACSPKKLTLERNHYQGPYRTELEMKEQLRLHNARDKN